MLNDLYDKVFDSNGNVKNCGREVCRRLIAECNKSCKSDSPLHGSFGDEETGIMNIEAIKAFIEKG